MKYALTDTGFWFALFNDRDRHHTEAVNIHKRIQFPTKILIPWPILYETLNTKFVKRSESLRKFGNIVTDPNVKCIDDSPYREEALSTTLRERRRFPKMSMVDCLLYLMMQRGEFRIAHFVTFDGGGHFGQICAKKGIEILPVH